jgi:hypothetical protein
MVSSQILTGFKFLIEILAKILVEIVSQFINEMAVLLTFEFYYLTFTCAWDVGIVVLIRLIGTESQIHIIWMQLLQKRISEEKQAHC